MPKKHPSFRRITGFTPAEVKNVFDEVYFELTDGDSTESISITGATLEFNHKEYNYALYGELDGYTVFKILIGDVRDLSHGHIRKQLESASWQYALRDFNL